MRAIFAISLLLLAACSKHRQLAQGPQPYLIVNVLISNGKWLSGTIGPDIPFEYSEHLQDGRVLLSMQGTWIHTDPSGFRFRWQVTERGAGKEDTSFAKEEFAPWGHETSLSSTPDHPVFVFYASKTADQLTAR